MEKRKGNTFGKQLLACSATVILLMSGCSSKEDKGIETAKKVVMQRLKDPDSAKFQNIRVINSDTIDKQSSFLICGEVNAKNSMGGYTGFTNFMTMFDMENDQIKPDGVVVLINKFVDCSKK